MGKQEAYVRVELSNFKPSILLIACFGAVLGANLAACSEPAVGAPCLPEMVPETGFDPSESYIEASSVQCETRVCLVYQLDGDPREGCMEQRCPEDNPDCCASDEETQKRIYCSCRCDAPSNEFAECECPDGFACTPILREGDEGVQGSYCVKKSTL